MKYVILNGLVQGRVFNQGPYGWRYMPFNSAQRTSRKGHPTPEAAIKGRTKGKIIEATTMQDAVTKAQQEWVKYQKSSDEAVPGSAVRCPECGTRPPGHRISCKTGNARAAAYQSKLTASKAAKFLSPKKPVEIEVCERLMDYGWLPHVEDGVYKGLRQVPKYHASIKGKKHWGCGMSRSEAIGSLIQSHPEMFNISVVHLQQKLPR